MTTSTGPAGPSGPTGQSGPTGPGAPGGPGRVGPVLIGVISFALVFLLIVGGTTAYLVYHSATRGGGDVRTSSNPSTDPSAETESGGDPTEEAKFCWFVASPKRVSSNPPGKLKSGPLEVTLPDSYNTSMGTPLPFADDLDVVGRKVESNWYASLGVGKIEWQTGYEYPGAEAASERLFDCYTAATGTWGSYVTKRHIEDQKTEIVTIDGNRGYRTSGTVVFDQTSLTATTGSMMVFTVVDTKEGSFLFIGEASVGVDETVTALEDAEKSLTLA